MRPETRGLGEVVGEKHVYYAYYLLSVFNVSFSIYMKINCSYDHSPFD